MPRIHKNLIIAGKVVHGQRLGKKLGFPTANLDRSQFKRLKIKPKMGIYAGWAEVVASKNQKSKIKNQKFYKAAIVIGPKASRGLPKIEAHLIGFRGQLYQKRLVLRLVKYLRPFQVFQHQESLIKNIYRDIRAVKKLKFEDDDQPL